MNVDLQYRKARRSQIHSQSLRSYSTPPESLEREKKLMGIPAEALNIAQAPERESQRRACMRGKIFEPFHTIGMRSKKSKAQRV